MKKLTVVIILTMLAALVAADSVCANDIDVYSVKLQNYRQNGASPGTDSTIDIAFDLLWNNPYSAGLMDDNSQTYFDRAWIFVKYLNTSVTGSGWKTATLTTGGSVGSYLNSSGTGIAYDNGDSTSADYGKPVASTDTNAVGRGAFCKIGANQILRWAIGKDGLNNTSHIYKVRIYAIEMVYVPTGPFYLGNTVNTVGSYIPGSTITSDAAVTLNIRNAWDTGNVSISVSAAFPKGWKGFYIMKYEMNQQQYCDFMNTITYVQQTDNLTIQANRNNISYSGASPSPRVATTTTPHIACNYVKWISHCAYADWACLRPMSELEYEKACRGGSATSNVVQGERAWGSATTTQATGISSPGLSNEGGTNTGGDTPNCVYGNLALIPGPLRSGWAATPSSNRVDAGASYYGVMDLTGNLNEMVALPSSGFLGTHGDGLLTILLNYEGRATNSDWPGFNATAGRGVTGFTGADRRGGSWDENDTANLRVCERDHNNSMNSPTAGTGGAQGVRLVRTVPPE